MCNQKVLVLRNCDEFTLKVKDQAFSVMIKFATNFFHFATWSLLPVSEVPLPNFHNFKIDWPYFCFHFRDLTSWINGIMALVTSDELAKDVASAEALLDRHQVRWLKTLYLDFQTKEVFRNSCQFINQSNHWLREQSTSIDLRLQHSNRKNHDKKS